MNSSTRISILAVCILLAGAAAFSPALFHGFTNWDDDRLVVWNPLVLHLSWETLPQIFTSFTLNHYHPFTTLSYAIEFRLFGWNPTVFHLTNIVLHSLNGLLVFWLILSIVRSAPAAFLAALLWVVHPLRVESVAWISERKDVLCAFFFLASLIAYIRYAETDRKRTFVLASLFAFAALLSKAAAITIPVAMLGYDLVTEQTIRRKRIFEKLPLFGLSLVFGAIAIAAQYFDASEPLEPSFGFLRGLMLACYNVQFYVAKFVLPTGLSPFYPFPEAVGESWPLVFWISPFLVLLLGWGWTTTLPSKASIFGELLFVATLLPVSQILPVGRALSADRFTYLPFIGFSLLVASLWSTMESSRRFDRTSTRFVLRCSGCGILIALAWLSWQQCGIWKDSTSLWDRVIACSPSYAEAYNNRGISKAGTADLAGALTDLDTAVRLHNTDMQFRFNRGLLLKRLGRLEEALADITEAVRHAPSDVSFLLTRASILMSMKRFVEAAGEYDRVLLIDEDNAAAREGLKSSRSKLEIL